MGFQKTASLMLLSFAVGGVAASAYWINIYDAAPDEPLIAINQSEKPASASGPNSHAKADTRPGLQTAIRPKDANRAGLVIPVSGIAAQQLTDTYLDSRGGGARAHQGIDIAAPKGTAALAAAAGKIEKLFKSDKGGMTIYVRSANQSRIYYYAHLSGYAPGLSEGQQVAPGDVIGYVGSTGNADPASPHLHFEIIETNAGLRWHEGQSVNPYPILKTATSAG